MSDLKFTLLTDEEHTASHDGVTIYRIRAERDIPRHGVKAGDIGGFVDRAKSLSHEGDCWIGDQARVLKGGRVSGDAFVGGNACVLSGAKVFGNSQVLGHAYLSDFVKVGDRAILSGRTYISRPIEIGGIAHIDGIINLNDVSGKSILRSNISKQSHIFSFRNSLLVKVNGGYDLTSWTMNGPVSETIEQFAASHTEEFHSDELGFLVSFMKALIEEWGSEG